MLAQQLKADATRRKRGSTDSALPLTHHAPSASLRSMVPEGSPERRSVVNQPAPREAAAQRSDRCDMAATQLPQDDEQHQSRAALATDADIKAVCAFHAACGETAPLGVPLGVQLRLRRAAARARDAVKRRKAANRQVVAYLELLDENGATRGPPLLRADLDLVPQADASSLARRPPVLRLLYVILYSASLASLALLAVAFGLQVRHR